MMKHQLLIRMRMHILSIELPIKRLINHPTLIIPRREQMVERQRLLLRLPLLLQHIGTDKTSVGKSFVPFIHEDVVFGVGGSDVFHGAEFGDAGADFVG